MFEALKKLVDNLEEKELSAKFARDSRKVLQSIKIEAQKCREKIITDLKKLPKGKKVNKKKKEVENDDGFFDRQ